TPLVIAEDLVGGSVVEGGQLNTALGDLAELVAQLATLGRPRSRASRSRNATTTAVVSVSPVRAATSRARRSASGSLTLSCTPQKFHPATERRGLQPSRNVERMPCESLAKILLGRSNYWEHRTRLLMSAVIRHNELQLW